MPIYVFEYTNKEGITKQVERSMSMKDMEKFPVIEVSENGIVYDANRIMAVTARMSKTWNYDKDTSDLPPVDYSPDGQ